MAFEPSSLLDVSHLLTFLSGVAVACGGQYMADKYTDKRRSKEVRSAEKIQFTQIKAAMPKILREMAQDLKDDTSKLIRELVVAPSRRANFMGSKTRFMYYLEEHPDIQIQIDRLLDAGYLEDVTTGNAPIYRMKEQFVQLLQEY